MPGAVGVDRAIGELQAGLASVYPWLDAVFGRAQRIARKIDGRRVVVPACYCGGWNGYGENDYIEVLPDSKIGNFVYFEVDDPEVVGVGSWARTITAPVSIVFWGDLRSLAAVPTVRNVERWKALFLNFLAGRTGWHLSHGRVTVSRVYERAENIYRGYTLDEVDAQCLMHPYIGFRIEGEIQFIEECVAEWPAEDGGYLRHRDGGFFLTSKGQRIKIW